jgi:hypothetical protein
MRMVGDELSGVVAGEHRSFVWEDGETLVLEMLYVLLFLIAREAGSSRVIN